MSGSSGVVQETAHPLYRTMLYAAGSLAIAATGFIVQMGGGRTGVLAAAGSGLLAAQIIKYARMGTRLTLGEALQDALVAGALAAFATAGTKVWQAPAAWPDIFSTTCPTAAVAALLYYGLIAYTFVRAGRHPSLAAACSIPAAPVLFNLLLLLQSSVMVERIGRVLTPGANLTPTGLQWIGKAFVLTVFNEAVAIGLTLLIAGRLLADRRIHGLLVASALLASATPEIAGLGSGASLASLPRAAGTLAAIAAAMLSQAGLWAQTFLVTGLIMDGLHSKQPSWHGGSDHFTSGFSKGAVYSGLFMGMIHSLAAILASPAWRSLVLRHPLMTAGLASVLMFPLLKTIVESFDGSPPFIRRAKNNYLRPEHYLPGAVVGVGIAFFLQAGLPGAGDSARFLYGVVVGSMAYAATHVLQDAFNIAVVGKRQRLQAGRVYLTEAVLGGLAGGALCWYFDALQTGVLVAKFQKYAALTYGAAGMANEDYVIYPLFSKWGAMRLGAVQGGVKLFYCESLSGVINWSIAAPLFSLNLVALTALVQWSRAPLRNLFTRQGLVEMVEQAFRVQRWGLWMAPIIYSFLRLSPDPTWYNQDGAIRTAVATVKSLTATPQAFHDWSLRTFVNLLAFDWFRIGIFVDHMGLRVATLVNLSFVGMDVVDEKTARFLGHPIRARVIPEALRRFVTWAPLLIPFYIPRGKEWDYAWSQAEAISRARPQELLPPEFVSGAFLCLAMSLGLVVMVRRLRADRGGRSQKTPLHSPRGAAESGAGPGNAWFSIGNGVYTLEICGDGRGWSRVSRHGRQGNEIDITRRPRDALDVRGKFFYLADMERPPEDPARVWSLCDQPMRRPGQVCKVTKTGRSTLHIESVLEGIRAEATVRVHFRHPVETWRLRLTNLGTRPRCIELTTYREFALNASEAYARHPEYNDIHVGTWFIPSLQALIAHNRKLKDGNRDPVKRRSSPEVAFHALGANEDGGVHLLGYEDSRSHFLGYGTLRKPQGLTTGPRDPADEGLLYSFDPIASLRLRVEIPAGGAREIVFADGYAANTRRAARLIRKHLHLRGEDGASFKASFAKRRVLHGFGAPADLPAGQRLDPGTGRDEGKPCYAFSADGTELRMSWDTPRPWSHVMANEIGYGTMVNNEGEIFSFVGNSQQNGITPFNLNSVPVQVPGQALYLQNRETGETTSPTFLPFRRTGEPCEVTFGRGYVVYRKGLKNVDIEFTVFVLPDEPLEMRILKVSNRSSSPVTYRVVPYLQIVLAEVPEDSRGAILAAYDEASQALFFSNPKNEFHRGWIFVATSLPVEAYETVRARFVGGPDHDLENPFMVEHGIPDASRPDDGCRIASFTGTLTVDPGREETVVMVVGHAGTPEEARSRLRTYRETAPAREALGKTRRWWSDLLSVLRVQTNDPAFDGLVNDWLPYQIFSSHLWGRSGPNQRSGGYGFRDQLQSMLPLLFLHPAIARRQILLHAGQQFLDGDVLQWWHPSWEGKSGLGARNRASDPHLWLPYVVCRYVEGTGDLTILDEQIPFLEGKPIPRGEEGVMFVPRLSRDRATLYRHCAKAIDFTLRRMGPHGLPKIGTGDWNDGLSLVGYRGRGESVWLGFLLYDVLTRFAPLAELEEGAAAKRAYLDRAEKLRVALDAMWRDGRYVRAITDSGEEMLSTNAPNVAWAVICGAADFEHGSRCLEQGLEDLEREDLVLLLSPPFTEDSNPYPGKLADYPPGVRENGGQYSHGASWLVDALVRLSEEAGAAGDPDGEERYLAAAVRVWRKVSPLAHMAPEVIGRFGLSPHQQPADIYFGYGCEGRGGWSWYTGAAARMLSAAYGILGLKMEKGRLRIPEALFTSKGPLQVSRLIYKGVEYNG
jgi:cyclic beta-1,2-glucan synthetase